MGGLEDCRDGGLTFVEEGGDGSLEAYRALCHSEAEASSERGIHVHSKVSMVDGGSREVHNVGLLSVCKLMWVAAHIGEKGFTSG